MSEERFTLDEAERLLAERECREHGHRWEVIDTQTFADPAGTPTTVVCSVCRDSYDVVPKSAP